jgi:hypothetical protein
MVHAIRKFLFYVEWGGVYILLCLRCLSLLDADVLDLGQGCVHAAAAFDHGLHTAVHAPIIIRVACSEEWEEIPSGCLGCILVAVLVGSNDAELARLVLSSKDLFGGRRQGGFGHCGQRGLGVQLGICEAGSILCKQKEWCCHLFCFFWFCCCA